MFTEHGAARPLIAAARAAGRRARAAQRRPAVAGSRSRSCGRSGAAFVLVRARCSRRSARTVAAARRNALDAHARSSVGAASASSSVRRRRARTSSACCARSSSCRPRSLADPTLLRAALLHELAHVRRRDALARLVQIVGRALLLWWPGRRGSSRAGSSSRAKPRAMRGRSRRATSRARRTRACSFRWHRFAPRAAPALAAPARARCARRRRARSDRRAHALGWIHRARARSRGSLLALGGARSAAAHGARRAARTRRSSAQALYVSHPEADLDGDGTLSRDEACELQAELRRARQAAAIAPPLEPDEDLQTLLAEPLCCNCDDG